MRLAPLWLAGWFFAALVAAVFTDGSHDLARALGSPSLLHPLGFDAFGRDLGATVLRAAAWSSVFAIVASLSACALALLFGSGIALLPPAPRFLCLRALDLTIAFPSLLLALAFQAARGPGWDTLLLSLSIGLMPSLTRLVYARAEELLAEEYVLAARALGATPWRLSSRHLAPALASLCAVKLPGLFAHALLAEATLSFLGVGAPIGRDTWGALLAQGKDYLLESPHVALGAGAPLLVTALALQEWARQLSERRFRV
jgi:peptide/nickel transport system permease protein